MRILVAPDKFAGTLTAAEAADAIHAGWRRTAPGDDIETVPLSDGGPGFLDVVERALGGTRTPVQVQGPLADPVEAAVLLTGEPPTAYVEAAQACDLHLFPADRLGPATSAAATSYGVGELVLAAARLGAARVVVGVGGTATTDGGAGLLAALGAQPADLLAGGGGALAGISDVDLAAARRSLGEVVLVAATDVGGPLMGSDGAAHGYAGQKGADRATRERLEEAMRAWATATDGALAVRPGAGAGGGLGFGLLLLGAERVPGAAVAVELSRLVERAAAVDVVVTGEGAFDWQSLRGKTVAGVARAAQQAARPVVVLAGRVEVGRRELASAGIDAAYAVDDLPPGEGGTAHADRLAGLAARVARTWSR